MRAYGDRFNHNLHALHIVESFERRYLDFRGLNLTFEVREGIIKHSRDYNELDFPELSEYMLRSRPPLEAQLIDLVDEIAYNTADLDDAFEAHLIDLELLRKEVPIFGEAWAEVDQTHPHGLTKLKFNEALKSVLNRLATDLIEHTNLQLRKHSIESIDEVREHPRRLASFSPAVSRMNGELKRFLFQRVYSNPAIEEERERCVAALDALFTFYMEHPDRMPRQHAELAEEGPTHRIVCDYIAGMTDHFLLRQHQATLHSHPEHDQ
jgi:dGTPase